MQYSTTLTVPVLVLNTCGNTVDVYIVTCTKTKAAPTRPLASSMPRVLLLHELQNKANVPKLQLLLSVSLLLNNSYLLLLLYRMPSGAGSSRFSTQWLVARTCLKLVPRLYGDNPLGISVDLFFSGMKAICPHVRFEFRKQKRQISKSMFLVRQMLATPP